MKIIIEGVTAQTAEERLKMEYEAGRFGEKQIPGFGYVSLWIDNQNATKLVSGSPVYSDVRSFCILQAEIWVHRSALSVYIRGQWDKEAFLVIDLQEQAWGSSKYVPFFTESVLRAFWEAEKKIKVEVKESDFLVHALRFPGGPSGAFHYYSFPHSDDKQKRVQLDPANYRDWFKKACIQASQFVREQKRIAEHLTCINVRMGGSANSCLWMWRATMLGNFLERFGLS